MAISAPSSTPGNCSGVTSGSRRMRTLGSPGFASRSKITASDSLASTKTPRTEISVVLSGSDAGERKHRMHQRVGAGGAVDLGCVLELVVADTVLAGNEDHRRRHDVGEVAGVVTGARGDAAMAVPERLGGPLDRIDQFWVEHRRFLAPDRIERNLDLAPRRDFRSRAPQILVDGIERFRSRAADIDGEGALAGDNVAGGSRNHRSADGADRVRTMLLRDPLNRQHDFRQTRQRVAAQRHRRGAGVAFETGHLAVVPDDALAAIDHADGLVLGLEQRSLLDMQFDEGAELASAARLAAAVADAIERLADGDAGGVAAA